MNLEKTMEVSVKTDIMIQNLDLTALGRSEISVLYIGNNPITMGQVYSYLEGLKRNRFFSEVCFNIKDGLDKLRKLHPNFLLLDDSLALADLKVIIKSVRSSTKTRFLPITLLKSNGNDKRELGTGVSDSLLKDALTIDRLKASIIRTLKKSEVDERFVRSLSKNSQRTYFL
ncbi:MAG: hypothetical protein HC842_01910 [Cytophagales bacterium]|nr:hypothetical protein [Cytophagales bacterium]